MLYQLSYEAGSRSRVSSMYTRLYEESEMMCVYDINHIFAALRIENTNEVILAVMKQLKR